ncbi:MAG: SUMF1/EgtB/PvdO family nonheme iron enzyme [Armatimonadota bacterium]
MKRLLVVTAVISLLGLGIAAQADVFNLGNGYTNLETVTVRDVGNTVDTNGRGSVSYNYNIGKYEVTAKQYCDFLNAKAKTDDYGLYNTSMWSNVDGCKIQRTGTSGNYTYSVATDWANRPVNYVSFWDACRFANWLNNGQGNGSTETGAYTLNGYTGNDGRTIQRNTEWTWAVTSQDEWYKAAYYKGKGTNSGYWAYPTQSNSLPSNNLTNPDPGNNANFNNNGYTTGSPYYRTNVGEFENSESAYGTYDQGGNVWEWTEANTANRGLRGGSYYDGYYGSSLSSAQFSTLRPDYEGDGGEGFRVSQIPEPSSIIALAGGLASLLCLRRRKA